MDFTDVTPSEIVFKQQLSCTRFSVIFLVVIRNTTCVMKVVRWMENFIKGIKEIQNALIQHSDVHPRNMMVVDGDPERAIWIDFDRAQTFDASFEYALVEEMASCMIRPSSLAELFFGQTLLQLVDMNHYPNAIQRVAEEIISREYEYADHLF
ncbi:hypothetical protein T310_1272 [Rasamsonia emersonii CBS 393.64]|uniref:Protein kinase domain-containing protein n=1 Tax=Rasamsonia emersonii (strain ATCC 16479 / CBS 393.64 / IMI 116815) TaxID=1408163 RepID=A0A0F4Z2F4_RASE3|nr:hypothetical protein T310_1272 [Rasamsonia emersonii CBS 393.64]KKA24689.1 hypothetical protein T310_1272 [Rasamsonia emersonii CBS 393.64]